MTRDAVVTAARAFIGTPYVHGASLEGAGCDCLGLVLGVHRALIGPVPEALPPYDPYWDAPAAGDPLIEAARRRLVACESAPRAGDVLLFRYRPDLPARHCAIASAPDRMIHAWQGGAVRETAIGPWWRRRLAGVFAFPGLEDGE